MKQDKKNRKNDQGKELRHLDMALDETASSTECTGLIPAAPVNGAEQEAYQAVFEHGAARAQADEEETR